MQLEIHALSPIDALGSIEHSTGRAKLVVQGLLRTVSETRQVSPFSGALQIEIPDQNHQNLLF